MYIGHTIVETVFKGSVSDLHFVKVSVKWLHILTANTDNSVWSVIWVLKSLHSAVNRENTFLESSLLIGRDWEQDTRKCLFCAQQIGGPMLLTKHLI